MTGLLRFATGTWAHPTTLFAGAWSLFLAVPIIFVGDVSDYTTTAWIAVGAIAAVSLSAPLAFTAKESHPNTLIISRPVRILVIAGALAGVASAIITQQANGISLGSIFSLDSVSAAARELSVLRYDKTQNAPAIATMLLGLTYASAFAAPFASAGRTGLPKVLYLTGPSLGAAAYAMLTTARAGLVICIAITVGGWFVANAMISGGRPKLPFRAIIGGLIAIAASVALFVVVAASRAGGFAAIDTSRLMRTTSLYLGGSIPALDSWIPEATGPYLGAQTFAGVAKFFPGNTVTGSAYIDFTQIAPGLDTNVYTAFRLLIEDFSILLLFPAIGLAGLIASVAYRRAVVHGSMNAAMITSLWGAYALFSQTTSLFSFTNVCFGVAVAWIVLALGVRTSPNGPSPLQLRAQRSLLLT